MRKLLLPLFILMSFFLTAESRVSITAKSGKLVAEINLEESEYIIHNEDFLYLLIESEHYDFDFGGYPEGEVNEYGDVLYDGKVRLEGDLKLKEGVEPGDYSFNVIVGFQTCDKSGVCNIPTEVAQEITNSTGGDASGVIPASLFGILLLIAGITLFRRKRRV